MLPAQRHHQLLVGLLLAPFVQHAHVRLAPVERFGGFAEAAGEAVVDEGELQGAFEGFEGGLQGWVWWLVFWRVSFGAGLEVGRWDVTGWREGREGRAKLVSGVQ